MNYMEEKLERVARKYEDILFEELNIPIAHEIVYRVNTRAKKRLGQCKLTNSWLRCFEIEVSSLLLNDDIPEETLANTIIHELLHTVEGCMNHGKKWKYYAEEVHDKLGIDIKRLASSSEVGIEPYRPTESIKYMFRCNGCGQEIKRRRRSQFVIHYHNYKCGLCNGNFEKVNN